MNIFSLTRQDTSVMKGIAICAMLCHHLYAYPPDEGNPYTGVIHCIGILGKVCVALFLFISGYGLAANYKPQSLLDDAKFIVKRLVKFYANYWVIFAIFVPITIFVFHRSLSDAYGEDSNLLFSLTKDILGVAYWNSYNITWWFNLLIIFLYLLFPILYRMINIKPWVGLIFSIVLARLCFFLPCEMLEMVALWQLPFVLGMVWKLCEDKLLGIQLWLKEHKYFFAIISILVLILTIVVRMYSIIPYWSGMRVDGFVSCAVALCVISIVRSMHYVRDVFSFLGKHSMNIYMMHSFFNGYWHPEWLHTCEWMRGGGNFVILMLLCVIVSVAVEAGKDKIGIYKLVQTITSRL